MKKILQLFILFILLIGSSFDTLEIVAAASSYSKNTTEKNQPVKGNSSRELVNDEIIFNKSGNQVTKRTSRELLKNPLLTQPASLCPLKSAAFSTPWEQRNFRPKQTPGYGQLFLLHLY